ncbi:unnamed protein product [Phytophthora lilii]|uniref:Unnamed protein product n=1 Tax=Phytophthora lilii TaxID=2077276 RepID=A0A9W6WGF3_9STRA|nr:unnamed protein product [Phytophthora lilii]
MPPRTVNEHLLLSPDPCSNTRFNGEYQDNLDSPTSQGIPVQAALDKLWRDEKHATDMKEIIVAIMSFSIFVAAMFLHIPTTSMYYQNHAMSRASGRSTAVEDLPINFIEIESVSDVFEWLNGTFVSEIFVTEDYNGKTLPENEWGQVGSLNRVLGAVSFRVTRMEPNECATPEFILKLYPSCYDESRTTTSELLVTFDTNATTVRNILAKKKASGSWINSASTQELLITVITINGEIPGYAVSKLRLYFNPGGYIEPSLSTTSTLLDQFPNATTIILDVLVIAWFFPWSLITALIAVVVHFKNMSRASSSRHCNELPRQAGTAISFWAFPDGWFAIDVLRGPIVLAFYVTVFITHFAMTNSTFRDKLAGLRDAGQSETNIKFTLSSVTSSFDHIADLTVWLRLLATAAVFVLGLRVLNTFRDHVGLSILTRTMASAVRSFRTFSVIFAVVFTTFASTGTILFGNSVKEFSSVLNSSKACVNMLFNNFDIGTIEGINYSVAFYWSYMATMTFVLLNIVLAIVVDAYKEEKDKKDKSKCWIFRRVLIHVLRHWLAPVHHALVFCCYRAPDQRCSVVFWGKIRSQVLQEALKDRLGTMPLDWSPETMLTARLLKTIFPQATMKECDSTIKHLVEKSINKDCCTKSVVTEMSDEDMCQSAFSAHVTQANSHDCFNVRSLETHDMEQISSRLDSLERKLDFLIKRIAKTPSN